MKSILGGEINSKVSNTGVDYDISGNEEVRMSPYTILHIIRQRLGERIAEHNPGPTKPLVEREPNIRHVKLRRRAHVVMLRVLISRQHFHQILHEENRVVVSDHHPPRAPARVPHRLLYPVDDPHGRRRRRPRRRRQLGEVVGEFEGRGAGRPREEVGGGGLVEVDVAAGLVGPPPRLDVASAEVPAAFGSQDSEGEVAEVCWSWFIRGFLNGEKEFGVD